MNITEAIQNRKSTRAFLDKEVEKEKIYRILETARWAPSGTNAQPWEVAVVQGEKKKELTQKMEALFREKGIGTMDYQYYPHTWRAPFKKRRVKCGAQLYGALGIERKDKQGRIEQWISNYRAFDAPVILFFFLDPIMQKGSYLDYGMFIQSVMLAAMDEGLATCSQAALGQYPKFIKNALDYPPDKILICGMALGYENTEEPVNNYRTTREDVEVFTRFFS